MTYNSKTREGTTYIWGFIWGTPRSESADQAQIRQCERDLRNLDDEIAKAEGSAV